MREYPTRETLDLAGMWEFAFLGNVTKPPEPGSVEFGDVMAVPGCFDSTIRYAGKRGIGAYRKAVDLAAGTRYRLWIDGGHHVVTLFVGGVEQGRHEGGFTQFGFDFTVEEGGLTDIVLYVDNRIDYDACPIHLDYFDWHHFGGIARGCTLQELPDVRVENVRFITTDYDRREVSVTADVVLADADALFTVSLGGKEFHRQTISATGESGGASAGPGTSPSGSTPSRPTGAAGTGMAAGGASVRVDATFTCPDLPLWTPQEPVVHELSVCIGEDCVTEQIGIRTVAVSGQDILINGEKTRLFGFNRHEYSPESGHTQSGQLLVTDLQLLEQMNVNFVRGSHYPQDERFIDLCDRRGIMVWCEATGWQHTEDHLQDRRFLDAQRINIEEMIQALGNHPSIIMWGLLNESHGHMRNARAGFAELVAAIREEDASRPVTYATCHVYEDKCLDLFDIVSFNTYPGWYVGGAHEIPQELDAILAHLDGSGYAEKPVILSEIGAGGIYGFRDWHRGLWSEEYQAELIQAVLDYFTNVDRLAGLALWQFCDIRASEITARALRRPRGFNNKGIVDEYRRPKLAFHVVRQFGKER